MEPPDEIQLAIGVVDLRRGWVRTHAGATRRLTPRERELLGYLVVRAGQVQTREQLLADVWGYSTAVVSRATDDTVKRLRAKVEEDPAHPVHLLTERGTGFRFEPLGEAPSPTERIPVPSGPRTLELGSCWVDLQRGQVHRPFAPSLQLSAQETAVLRRLAASPGRATDRADLLPAATGRALDNTVRRLREKLEGGGPAGTATIRTARGRGYELVLPGPPPNRTGGPPRTNLTATLDALLGRSAELDLLRTALGRHRLVVVVGPGGVGKTRLVREHGLATAAATPGGVWFCDGVGTTRAAGLVRAVTHATGERLPPSELATALRRRGPTVLLLDNVEQISDDELAVVVGWLAAAPQLRVVLTSRRLPGLPGAHMLWLGPLAPPDAIALYEARASHLWPRPPGHGPIAALIELLDGMPLAIELAAARAAALGPAEVIDRLQEGLGVLRAAHPSERHGALSAVIEWSWRLLDPPARQMLAQCSVFRGPFTLELAEAVVRLTEPATDPVSVLQQLFEHSIVRNDRGAFALHAVVQRFAAGKLPGDEASATRGRHAAAFAAAARRSRTDLEDRWQDAHREDLLSAVEHALGDPGGETMGIRMVLDIAQLLSRGAVQEHLRLLDRAAQRSESVSGELRNQLALEWCTVARIAAVPGVGSRLRALVARADIDGASAVRALIQLGDLQQAEHDYPGSLVTLREALARARSCADPDLEADCARSLGGALADGADLEEAEELLTLAAARYELTGQADRTGQTLNLLGEVAIRSSAFDEARELFERSAQVAGAPSVRAMALQCLGVLGHLRGDLAAARAAFDRARELLAPIGLPRRLAALNLMAALATHEAGDLEAADGLVAEAQSVVPEPARGLRAGIAVHRSLLLAERGRHREAARTLASAEKLLDGGEGDALICVAKAFLQLSAGVPPDPPLGRVLQRFDGAYPTPSLLILRRLLDRALPTG